MIASPDTIPAPAVALPHDLLARWAYDTLVNRTDVWGAYGRDSAPYTAPSKYRRGKDRLNLNVLNDHFAGGSTIGLHAIAPDNTSRFICFDIDCHTDTDSPLANWEMAMRIADVLDKLGLRYLIEDSDGKGGFHVWVISDEPVPTDLIYRLGQYVLTKADAKGTETYPKQPKLTGLLCGSWVRIPGKHHKRDHWSRFYDRETETWLEGDAAVEALLHAPVNDIDALIRIAPILPALPKADPADDIKLNVLPDGPDPVCIKDLEHNGIRKSGGRNALLLSLARYYKACGLTQGKAKRRAVAAVRRLDPGMTSVDPQSEQARSNAESVVAAVYAGEYPFRCSYMLANGSKATPVACNGSDCKFVDNGPVTDGGWRSEFVEHGNGSRLSMDSLTVARADWRAQLIENRLQFLRKRDPKKVGLDRSGPGLGKTAGTAEAFGQASVGRTVTLTGTHNQADSIMATYRKHGLSDSCTYPKPRSPENCFNHGMVQQAEAMALNVSKAVCRGCRHSLARCRATQSVPCGYQSSMVAVKENVKNAIGCNARVADPEVTKDRVLILDEDPIAYIRPLTTLDIGQLAALLELLTYMGESARRGGHKWAKPMLRLRDLADSLLRIAAGAGPELERVEVPEFVSVGKTQRRVRGRRVGRRSVADCHEYIFAVALEENRAQAVRDALGDATTLDVLFDLLDRKSGAEVYRQQIGRGFGKMAKVLTVVKVVRTVGLDNATLIVQDATADPAAIAKAVGRDVVDLTPEGKPESEGRLIQILNRSLSRSQVRADFDKLVRAVRSLLSITEGTVGLLTYAGSEAALLDALPEDERDRVEVTGHFHNESRGVNSFINVDLLIVAGTPDVPPEAVTDYLLRVDPDAVVGTIVPERERQVRTVVTAEGTYTTKVNGYSDPRWESARQAIVAAELTQAAGRGRNLSDTGPVTVVLSNEPLPSWTGAAYTLVLELSETEAEILTAFDVVADDDGSTKPVELVAQVDADRATQTPPKPPIAGRSFRHSVGRLVGEGVLIEEGATNRRKLTRNVSRYPAIGYKLRQLFYISIYRNLAGVHNPLFDNDLRSDPTTVTPLALSKTLIYSTEICQKTPDLGPSPEPEPAFAGQEVA